VCRICGKICDKDPELRDRHPGAGDRVRVGAGRIGVPAGGGCGPVGKMSAMSQPVNPRAARSFAGMIGALIVVVAIGVVWVKVGGSDEKAAPVQSVDWSAWMKAGRAEQQLLVFAPSTLPPRWRASSATYLGGSDAHWHLGLLTDSGKYVGIEESRAEIRDLVEQYVDQDAVRGKDVVVAGQTWQTWTDSGGDYALVRSVDVGGRPYESVLVGGSAPAPTVRSFAATLTSGTVRAAG
jgi:hypothetical protein